jgi:GT2 family glycosyltransferase
VGDPTGGSEVGGGSGSTSRVTVTFVILVLDRVDLLEGCLTTIGRSTSRPSEVVVVANGTPEPALAGLGSRSDILLVRSGVNLGFGGGCNLAAESARGDHLVFVNDDSRLAPGCVDHLLRRALDEPGVGAVGSRIFAGDGSLQEAGGIIWSDGTTAHVGRDLPAGDAAYLTPREVDYCSANGLLVPRSAWDAVGGFDEAYYPGYYEDADLCMKLRARGLGTVYEPTATLVHLETQSSSPSFRRFLMDRNRETFRRRWSDALVAHPPPPVTDRRGAIDARVASGRTLPPLDVRAPWPDPVVGAGMAPPGRGGAEGEGDELVRLRREVDHAIRALEVKDAYIARLDGDLQTCREREWRRTRWPRAVRRLGLRLRSAVPPEVKAKARSWRGDG